MKEKELRLALVCFGGISLAVYMHGVSKEVLKLVRASKLLFGIHDVEERQKVRFHDLVDPGDPEFDTDEIYFDLLRMIARKIELRVVVDVIAGASAGGINGVILGRALAHDLPIGQLRDRWLNEADVNHLLDNEGRARMFSKFYVRPVLWLADRMGFGEQWLDSETKANLSVFMRSRWFRPPFGAKRMNQILLDALDSMGPEGKASLLPNSHKLELFVTITDFYGYQRPITIHDPPLIREREHRHVFRFAYEAFPNGDRTSDFDLENVPALVFAARATSSFPGAFPPARIPEIDDLMNERGRPWLRRGRFLEHNFASYHQAESDPTRNSFVDGSVLNNKPFKEAIAAIQGRPAYREVDRRLVYIDPDPGRSADRAPTKAPGFWVTLKGALSDIPRNEPIGDELIYLVEFNERVGRQKAIIEQARPSITRLVTASQPENIDGPLSQADIRLWRETANNQVKANAGFAYEGYVRLKIMGVQVYVAHLIATLAGAASASAHERWILLVVQAWARREGMVFTEGFDLSGELPPWVGFLLSFDVDFRRRRLQFLIQGQNRLYAMAQELGQNSKLIDTMKRRLYERLDELRRSDLCEPFSDETRVAVQALFGIVIEPQGQEALAASAAVFAEKHGQEISKAVARMADEIKLDAHTDRLDEMMAAMEPTAWAAACRRDVLINYIGFSFWDVLTLSITNWRDLVEFDEIRVDRISPEDAKHCRRGVAETLKGTRLGHFGAFFSRQNRENDYLWGRFHAVDRLIEIVCDAAGIAPNDVDISAFKKRAFLRVLEADGPHLQRIQDLLEEVRAEVEAL